MKKMQRSNDYFEQVVELVRWVSNLHMTVYAANACFFLVLAVFPLLLLILASLRFTPLSAVDLLTLLDKVLPEALIPAAESLVVNTYYNSSGALVSVSAITALWSASRGMHGLMIGLNHVYGVQEDRKESVTRLLSVLYLFLFLVVLVLTLVLRVFGQTLDAMLPDVDFLLVRLLSQLIDFNFVILLVAQTLIFTMFYMVLPNRRNKFMFSWPGALVAAVGWQLFSRIFSYYVTLMTTNYSNIYGSVYTVAVAMLWLYWCMLIILFGGIVNKMLQVWFRK